MLAAEVTAELEETKRKLKEKEQKYSNGEISKLVAELTAELDETKRLLQDKEQNKQGEKVAVDRKRFFEMQVELDKLIDLSESFERSLQDKQRTIRSQAKELEENDWVIRSLKEKGNMAG